MTSARNLEKFIHLVPHARPPSGRCLSLQRFWPTLFSIQQSRFISRQFAHCILSKASRILWLIACSYNEYLEEFKRTQGDTSSLRLPVTDDIMVIFRALDLSFPGHCMFWAACNLAYFSFLHSAEFTVPNLASSWPSIHLGLADVALDSLSSPSCLQLRIKVSKTDSFRKGCFLHIGKGKFPLCTIHSLLAYLTLRGDAPGPLFLFRNRQRLTHALLTPWFRDILSSAGIQGTFSSHSFRIGAATVAARNGILDHQIQALR